MIEELRKCVHCGALLRHELVDWEEYVQGRKVVVPGVPAAVCPQCGEKYVHSEVLDRIDRELDKAREQEEVLEVRLREVRRQKNLTQAEVARRMGFSLARYSAIERNKKVPSVKLALKLARALECRVEDIYSLRWQAKPVDRMRQED